MLALSPFVHKLNRNATPGVCRKLKFSGSSCPKIHTPASYGRMNTQSHWSNAMTPRFDAYDARNAVIVCQPPAERPPSELLNLEELRNRCMGNIQFVQRVLKKFQQRIPEELAELEKALELSDTEQIARIAHRVKGTSASVSANGLKQAATEIEDLSRAGHITDIPACIEHLRDEWDRCNCVVCGVISGGEQNGC